MVKRPQRREGEEVQFVVSDRQLLQLTCNPPHHNISNNNINNNNISNININNNNNININNNYISNIWRLTFEPLEGGAVYLCNLVVVELKRREAGQTLEVARAQFAQVVVVQSQEIKRLQA